MFRQMVLRIQLGDLSNCIRAQRCPGAFLVALTPPVDKRLMAHRCGACDSGVGRFAACSQAVGESSRNADTEAAVQLVHRRSGGPPDAVTQSGETVGASASYRRASTSGA